MTEKLYSYKNISIKKTALFFMGIYLFVLNFPHVITIRETSFFLAIILAVIVHVKDGKWEWSPLKIQFLFWVGVALVSLSVSNDVWYSLSEIKKEILYSILSFWLFYVITRNKEDFIFLSYFVLFSATLIIMASIYHYYGLGHRFEDLNDMGILYGKATYTSVFMFITAILCITIALHRDNPIALRLYSFLLIPASMLLHYFARHRAGYLSVAFAVFLAILIMISRSSRLTGYKRGAAYATITIILLLPVMILIANKELSWNSQGALASFTNDSRWAMWDVSIEKIVANPLLGSGFGRKYFDVPALGDKNFYPHNFFLSYGVMMGIPGIIILAALFGKLYLLLQKNLNKYYPTEQFCYLVSIGGILILGGFIVTNLLDDSMVRHTGLFFWSIMGMILGSCRNMDPNNSYHTSK
jgi:O-antigen ligase